MRIEKTDAILKCPVNKLFQIEYSYHGTNQTDDVRSEATLIGGLKRKYD